MKRQQVLQDTDRARFAIQLRSLDVQALSAGGLNTVWRQLGAFLGHESPREDVGVAFVSAKPRPHPMDKYRKEVVEACQASARTLLARHVAHETVAATVTGSVTVSATAGRFMFRARGRAEVFQLVLVYLLSEPVGARIRKCPECGEIFLRVRRQLYCSDTCTDRVTWRNYPPVKKRRARKKQYEKHGWTLGARTTKGERHGKTTRTR